MDVLKKVPHRHFVFSIPKILRRYFLYDRKLFADLSRCAWESLKVFLQDAVPENDPIPGTVIALQTLGDFLGYNFHAHILVTEGCFYGNKGMFRVTPPLELKKTDDTAMENLVRYIIRASFSQERMQYLDQEGEVVYTSKDGRTSKNFPTLEWLANLCSHIPNRGEQMVCYYGHYSNVSRGKRQKHGSDDVIPCLITLLIALK